MVSWLLRNELLKAARVNAAPPAKYRASAWPTTERTPVFFRVMFCSTRFAPLKYAEGRVWVPPFMELPLVYWITQLSPLLLPAGPAMVMVGAVAPPGPV